MKILIVEDEFLIVDMIKIMLKQNGFTSIEHANTLKYAHELLENNPDICLLDIRLGEENGIDFGKVLDERKIPFLYITANNDIQTIKLAAITNPQSYLSKPINEKDLV